MPQLPSHIIDLETDELSSSPLLSPSPSSFLSPTPAQLSRLDVTSPGPTSVLSCKPTSKTRKGLTRAGARKAARKPAGKRIAEDSELKLLKTRKPRGSNKGPRILKSSGKTSTIGSKGPAQPTKPMTASKSGEKVNEMIQSIPKSTQSTDEWETVREICDRRGAKDFVEYQVKWGGYDSDDPRAKSWVPRTMLVEDVPEDVEEFDRTFSPAKRARRARRV